MNIQALKLKIQRAAEAAFAEVRKKYSGERFCGYALYSDPDAVTVCPAVNSLEYLERMIRNDPDDDEYYRWSPGEWSHGFEGAEHFAEISSFLAQLTKPITSSAEHNTLKKETYEACVAALEAMFHEGFFNDLDRQGVVVFAVSDSDVDLECDWIARLNRADVASEFRDWMG